MNKILKNVQHKFKSYVSLTRFNIPTGGLLLLWPTCWALWLSNSGTPSKKNMLIFFLGAWLMRAAGCAFNDFTDYKFDKYVKRTAYRPIPNKDISRKEGLIISIILVFFALILSCFLTNVLAKLLSIPAFLLTIVYPFSKRYIYFPQVILGIAFSFSILMVFAEMHRLFSSTCWLLFCCNTFWTVAYDTQYSVIDRAEDIKIGIKSTSVLLKGKENIFIGILQICMILFMIIIGMVNHLGWEFYFSLILISGLFVYQKNLIEKKEATFSLVAFKNNIYVGLLVFLGIVFNYN